MYGRCRHSQSSLTHACREGHLYHIICVGHIKKCMNTNGFTSRDKSFLLKEKETLFRHHKNVWLQGGQYIVCWLSTYKDIRNKASECCYSPHTWPGYRVIDNNTIACYLFRHYEFYTHTKVLLYLENHVTYGQPPIPHCHNCKCLPNIVKSQHIEGALPTCSLFKFDF